MTTGFGGHLKLWRTARRYSQLDLATTADVSQRHLSFLESGRSNPSREMVLHLAAVLDVPLRRQNEMLVAAGFAPAYRQGAVGADDFAGIGAALERVLVAHEPNPAVMVDRAWNVVMSNAAATRLTPRLVDPATPAIDDGLNLIRLALHPEGLRRVTVNFDEVASVLVGRLEDEVLADPTDTVLGDLLDEVLAYPGVARPERGAGPAELVVPIHYRTDDFELRLFTLIATIGSPGDISLDELRLETFLPVDAASAEVLAGLAA